MNHSQLLRNFAALAWLAAALACADSDERRAEAALLTADSEEEGLQGLLSLNYEITSEVFKKWKRAQLALDRELGRSRSRSLKASIIGTRPTREAIERAVARIEENSRARRAIEQAGMSPRHYVVATVALFQATRGIDPITGETFRGVPARNVEFARQNREQLDTAGEAREFQEIADSIARARAEMAATPETVEVIVDTVPPRVPVPTPPTPIPTPTPTPTPRPTQPPPRPPTDTTPATPAAPDQPSLR
ncbi:MAG: hypothetical protein NUW01_07190 [Gemmatimonadaceae bacterium]|nr:hypothetical protein [Gemmatimonadaceae bacterium]